MLYLVLYVLLARTMSFDMLVYFEQCDSIEHSFSFYPVVLIHSATNERLKQPIIYDNLCSIRNNGTMIYPYFQSSLRKRVHFLFASHAFPFYHLL